MNLYSNIGNFSSAFNGWRAEPKESFRASDWQPIPPPAIPQPSGYIPSLSIPRAPVDNPAHENHPDTKIKDVALYDLKVVDDDVLRQVETNVVMVTPDPIEDTPSKILDFSDLDANLENLEFIPQNPVITGDIHAQVPAPTLAEQPLPKPQISQAHPAPASETPEAAATHPLNQSIGVLGDAATYADAALANPHQSFLAETEKLKNSASLKHDLASGFSRRIMEFEEGGMLDERKAYYANNREALNEAVEKIRTDAAETTQKYGEMSGKLHLLNGITKITGGISNAADAYELGSRINTASQTDNWDPVAGQIAKIVAAAVSVVGSAAVARGMGLMLLGMGAPAGFVAAATIVGGVVLTYFALEGVEALEKKISMGDSVPMAASMNTNIPIWCCSATAYPAALKVRGWRLKMSASSATIILKISKSTARAPPLSAMSAPKKR